MKQPIYREMIKILTHNLPKEQVLVLNMYYCDGMDFHEIAKATGLSQIEVEKIYHIAADKCASFGQSEDAKIG